MSNDIRKGRHCIFQLHAHLVFVTKYRKHVFTKEILQSMEQIFVKICDGFEVKLTEFNGEEDHVHLLVNYPPNVSLSKLVNSLKGVSSRLLRQLHPELTKLYWKNVLWSPSYFAASCGGAPIDIIKQYIEQHKTPQ
jgi:putative transposase